jgi:hypothetical protein
LRLVVATVLTLVALPVLYAENRETQDQRPTAVAAAGLGDAISIGTPHAGTPATTAAPVAEPFLAAPVTLVPRSTKAPTAIAVRSRGAATVVQGKGTYRQWEAGYTWVTNPCVIPGAPAGETVTVENIDNGFKARCVNVGELPAPKAGEALEVVLDTDVFALLADLAEAPVPLQLSW